MYLNPVKTSKKCQRTDLRIEFFCVVFPVICGQSTGLPQPYTSPFLISGRVATSEGKVDGNTDSEMNTSAGLAEKIEE